MRKIISLGTRYRNSVVARTRGVLLARSCNSVFILLGCLAAASCEQNPSGPNSAFGDDRAQLEPELPAGYSKIAPSAASTSRDILSQTATVFTGVLRDIRLTYSDCAGPRTQYGFGDSSPLLGSSVESEVTLKLLGGPTPRGTFVSASEIPRLALGARYVVFLRNTDWTYSPVVGDLLLRQEEAGARTLLINSNGQALIGWNRSGPSFSAETVSGTVGQRRTAYRTYERSAPEAEAPSETDYGGRVIRIRGGGGRAMVSNAPADRPLSNGPTALDLVRAGMFSRPPLASPASIAAVQGLSAEALVRSLQVAERAEGIRIGGAARLDPLWKCWSTTDTVRPGRQREVGR